jgi:hypothetical protein
LVVVAGLEDVPDILSGMAEFAACYAGTEIELADSDAVVLDVVREVVIALGHGTYKDGNALALVESTNVVADTYDLRIETERDLAAIRWQMVGDGVLDNLDELFLGCCRADLMPVQELDHKTGKSLERTRDAHCRADPDEHILGSVDVDLEFARLVDWRV